MFSFCHIRVMKMIQLKGVKRTLRKRLRREVNTQMMMSLLKEKIIWEKNVKVEMERFVNFNSLAPVAVSGCWHTIAGTHLVP